MSERKQAPNHRKRKETRAAHHSRKGVCSICGARNIVRQVPEFDDQLLCESCCDDTALVWKYVQSDQISSPETDEDELFIDDDLG
jgi:hypothetical protein